MANELILMPLRIGIRVANVCLRPVASVAGQLLELTGRVRDATGRHETPGERSAEAASPASASASASSTRARESESPRTTEARQSEPPEPTETREPEARQATAVIESESSHVSEEAELVTELAEPGAENGAGAEIRVDEPWSGYGELTADQVIARLNTSSPEELAVVELYENSTRQRQSVLSAVERELKRAAAGRPAN